MHFCMQTVFTDSTTWKWVSVEDVWLLLLTQGMVIDEEASPRHWLVTAALVQMFVAVVCWCKAPAQEGKMNGLEP